MSVFRLYMNDDEYISIELLFGMVDGASVLNSLYNGNERLMICRVSIHGFRRIDYAGRPVLAPGALSQSSLLQAKDISSHVLDADRKRAFDNPFHDGIHACHPQREALSVTHNNVEYHMSGMYLSFEGMCTAASQSCPSIQARDLLIQEMLRVVNMVAVSSRLRYSLACDSLLYLRQDVSTPPLNTAIAIMFAESDAWINAIEATQMLHTFVIKSSEAGAFALYYSDQSDIHIVFHDMPMKVSLNIEENQYPGANRLQVFAIKHQQELGPGLSSLCRQLNNSAMYEPPPLRMGGLLNAASRTCLQLMKTSNGSWSIGFDKCNYRGGVQHVELRSNQQLVVGIYCLKAISNRTTNGLIKLSLNNVVVIVAGYSFVLSSCKNATTPGASWVFEKGERYIRHIGMCVYVCS